MPERDDVFARRVFTGAGIYGVLCIAPMYFLESRIAAGNPPAITHPEFYYGFVGVTLAWQLVFLVIGRDPLRYRPLMPVAMLEKLAFGLAVPVLMMQGRVSGAPVVGAAVDMMLFVLFAVSYLRTRTA
ncbi:MAG TPA: hypothetical protein VEC57_09995 [Candidatus Limnocylindrales bacterium]|nr:hypothetical protein [Candidatus Limnocylindrales bacterium]